MKYRFTNEAERAVLKIYDTIGDDGWGGGVTTKNIEEQLATANGKPLDIYINSYGGEVFEGFAIYNIIKRYNGEKTVYIDGIAASIASVIALSGDKLVMNEASMFMIHNASGVCIGNAEDMKKVVQALESINETIKDIYKNKCKDISDEKLTELMDNETFLTAKECLDYGFCDEVVNKELDDAAKNIMSNSLESIKNEIDQKLKMYNEIKELYNSNDLKVKPQVVVDENGNDDDKPTNKTESRWAFLI